MNSVFKPVWTLKPANLAAVTGVAALPVVAMVAWNVMDQQFKPETSPVAVQAPAADAVSESSSALPVAEAESPNQADFAAAAPQRQRAVATRKFSNQRQLKGMARSNGLILAKPAAPSSRPLYSVQARPVLPVPKPQAMPDQSERYTKFEDRGVTNVATSPVSTFSIDVDTASYARVRAALKGGNLPPRDMVRVEEMINYFDYAYPLPEDPAQPFKPTVTITPTPWNAGTQLMTVGIKGYDIVDQDQPDSNLVFLLDVSGSMNQANKLPLLINSFQLLLQKLKPTDKVSIVTYAGRSATLLDSVNASDRATIRAALQNLQAGGSTAGAGGIEQAYRLAEKNFVDGGVNRVMLATDGDFNVGISDPVQLKDLIAKKRKSGVFLSVFGFGQGNYNDALMQKLAQNGNGQAAYIDTLAEAQKTLVEEANGTMFTIAKDVKIQLEFNPARIAEYRLIGYETRALRNQDFNNDRVDAGEVGAGHSVTAIYEITPVGSPAVLIEPLRYGKNKSASVAADNPNGEIGFLKLRYKLPDESRSRLLQQAISYPEPGNSAGQAKLDTGFSTAVAAFAQKLRGNPALQDFSYQQIGALARAYRGDDNFGYRSEFLQLVRIADALSN
ncbi:MAG: VWA domain-containing protein [Rhizobiaceae bacterium]